MKVERVRPSLLRITLHAYELAALIAAARLATETAGSELPAEAVKQLRQVLVSYDGATHRTNTCD